MAKYEKQLEQLFRHLFYEEWMDEEDWREVKEAIFNEANLNYETLSNQIDEGITNGFGLLQQFEIIKKYFPVNTKSIT